MHAIAGGGGEDGYKQRGAKQAQQEGPLLPAAGSGGGGEMPAARVSAAWGVGQCQQMVRVRKGVGWAAGPPEGESGWAACGSPTPYCPRPEGVSVQPPTWGPLQCSQASSNVLQGLKKRGRHAPPDLPTHLARGVFGVRGDAVCCCSCSRASICNIFACARAASSEFVRYTILALARPLDVLQGPCAIRSVIPVDILACERGKLGSWEALLRWECRRTRPSAAELLELESRPGGPHVPLARHGGFRHQRARHCRQ